MATKKENGSGNIRKRKDGTWEGRFCVGTDPKTGKPIRKSIYGKTKGEISKKLRELTVDRDNGDLFEPTKMTVGEWLTYWEENCLDDVKYLTKKHYMAQVENHIRPLLGGVKMAQLSSLVVQAAYKKIREEGRCVPVHDENGKVVKDKNGVTVTQTAPLSAKSFRNIHGIFSRCMNDAKELGLIKNNPCEYSGKHLPKVEKEEPKYLEEDQRKAFLKEIQGDEYNYYFQIVLWLGLRESEAAGLTWDCIDFDKGTVTIRQQLIKRPNKDGGFTIASPKNSKYRTIVPAPFVMEIFKKRKAEQAEQRLIAGELWEGWKTPQEQKTSLVFTTEYGAHLHPQTIYNHYKKIAARIGAEDTCVHSLRHTHVVLRLENEDNVKIIQESVGHYSASFTLDRYGHVSAKMQKDSADKMQAYFESMG